MNVNSMEGPEPELEELDVEAFAKSNPVDREKPRAAVYIIRIDRDIKQVRESSLTGKQILALVSKTPETHKLFQKFRDRPPDVVTPEEVVSFRKPGVERFQTIPKDTTEGARRE